MRKEADRGRRSAISELLRRIAGGRSTKQSEGLCKKKKRAAIGKRPACMRGSFGIGQGKRNEERSGSRKEIRDFRIAASDCGRAKHEAIRRLMQKKEEGSHREAARMYAGELRYRTRQQK